MTKFLAVDVETANADYSSICQVGLAEFENGKLAETWVSYVDPKSVFDPMNTSIHGISNQQVSGAPDFSEVFLELQKRMTNAVVVHHGHFDFTAFRRCYDRYSLKPINCAWIDNTNVVRRTWAEFSQSGYGLANLVKHFALPLDHHDALSDAVAAGRIFQNAVESSGRSPRDWAEELKLRPRPIPTTKDFRRDGDAEAPFFGEKIVFTGALGVSRETAANVAQNLGFDVQNGVTKSTTFLCVGTQDSRVLGEYSKSSKHRKAEDQIRKGQQISILSEEDFWEVAKVHSTGEIP